jgi:hypothetical protein
MLNKRQERITRISDWMGLMWRGRPAVVALAAGLVLCGALPVQAADTAEEPELREMTEDLAKALGPDVVSVVTVNEAGDELIYLRSDVFEEGSTIDYGNQVNFPINVTQIRKVKYIGGSKNIVRIDYSTNPDKNMECKWVGTVYRCYSN